MACKGCEFRSDLYYDSDYQIWVSKEPDGSLKVGMTDISQTIAGRILHVRVRRPGTVRPAGKPVATVESGKWAGPVPNPIDCEIIEGNQVVLDNPSLLNKDPYGAWIARVKPVNPAEDPLAKLLTGSEAEKGFCARAERDDIECRRVTD
jgi:glycine cleavage system H protein